MLRTLPSQTERNRTTRTSKPGPLWSVHMPWGLKGRTCGVGPGRVWGRDSDYGGAALLCQIAGGREADSR